MICGGGWGTATNAMAAGVPLVVIPHGLDTANTGRVVEAAGCGIAIDGLRAGGIAAELRRVLGEPEFAAAAGRLAEPDAAAGAVRRALMEIEG